MNPEFAIEIVKAMLMQAVAIATPILMTAMVIGLAVSLFQAVSSIHEQTLSFVPKALGICALLIALMPWILRVTMEFTTTMINRIPEMTR